MKRIGLFVDVSNLYKCLRLKYQDKKLDYEKYMTYIKDLGEIIIANAYGAQLNEEAKSFINCLKILGFTPKYKKLKEYINREGVTHKANWDVGITVDIVKAVGNLDIIILGSADGDFVPLVSWIQEQGKTVIILACGISRELKDICSQAIEIPESMIESKEIKEEKKK